jgi:hypothetical protein
VAAVAQRAIAVILEQAFEEGLPPLERQVAQVVAVEVEQVEGVVGERVRRALLKRSLQIGEAASSLLVEDDHFAVENGAVDGELGGGFCNVAHAMGPVETTTREEAGAALSVFFVDMDLNAIAVELELVQPVIAFRRLFNRRGQFRRKKAGHLLTREHRAGGSRDPARAGLAVQAAAPSAGLFCASGASDSPAAFSRGHRNSRCDRPQRRFAP